jgi:hypothetical protein
MKIGILMSVEDDRKREKKRTLRDRRYENRIASPTSETENCKLQKTNDCFFFQKG